MTLRLGDPAPDFTQESTAGKIHFSEWKGDSWAVLFSHPADFTPVRFKVVVLAEAGPNGLAGGYRPQLNYAVFGAGEQHGAIAIERQAE